MARTNELWTPLKEDEIKEWRRDLPKGHVRESNTAHHLYPTTDAEGDRAVVEAPASSGGKVPLARTAPPREVADEVFGLMWLWAKKNPENYALMAQIVRHNNPDAFGHLSDDELRTKLEEYAKSAGRRAAEAVYKENDWDRGNDLDMARGKPVTP